MATMTSPTAPFRPRSENFSLREIYYILQLVEENGPALFGICEGSTAAYEVNVARNRGWDNIVESLRTNYPSWPTRTPKQLRNWWRKAKVYARRYHVWKTTGECYHVGFKRANKVPTMVLNIISKYEELPTAPNQGPTRRSSLGMFESQPIQVTLSASPNSSINNDESIIKQEPLDELCQDSEDVSTSDAVTHFETPISNQNDSQRNQTSTSSFKSNNSNPVIASSFALRKSSHPFSSSRHNSLRRSFTDRAYSKPPSYYQSSASTNRVSSIPRSVPPDTFRSPFIDTRSHDAHLNMPSSQTNFASNPMLYPTAMNSHLLTPPLAPLYQDEKLEMSRALHAKEMQLADFKLIAARMEHEEKMQYLRDKRSRLWMDRPQDSKHRSTASQTSQSGADLKPNGYITIDD